MALATLLGASFFLAQLVGSQNLISRSAGEHVRLIEASFSHEMHGQNVEKLTHHISRSSDATRLQLYIAAFPSSFIKQERGRRERERGREREREGDMQREREHQG